MQTLTADNENGNGAEDEAFVELRAAQKLIRDKIVHTLTIWPQLSPSMLQVGIGTAITPKLWHPILKDLEEAGIIVRTEVRAKSHIGRDQVYTILRLNSTPAR